MMDDCDKDGSRWGNITNIYISCNPSRLTWSGHEGFQDPAAYFTASPSGYQPSLPTTTQRTAPLEVSSHVQPCSTTVSPLLYDIPLVLSRSDPPTIRIPSHSPRSQIRCPWNDHDTASTTRFPDYPRPSTSTAQVPLSPEIRQRRTLRGSYSTESRFMALYEDDGAVAPASISHSRYPLNPIARLFLPLAEYWFGITTPLAPTYSPSPFGPIAPPSKSRAETSPQSAGPFPLVNAMVPAKPSYSVHPGARPPQSDTHFPLRPIAPAQYTTPTIPARRPSALDPTAPPYRPASAFGPRPAGPPLLPTPAEQHANRQPIAISQHMLAERLQVGRHAVVGNWTNATARDQNQIEAELEMRRQQRGAGKWQQGGGQTGGRGRGVGYRL